MAEPFEDAKQEINAWYDGGFEIIFFTARGWEQYNITKHWLDTHGFRYDRLICGKPIYDISQKTGYNYLIFIDKNKLQLINNFGSSQQACPALQPHPC